MPVKLIGTTPQGKRSIRTGVYPVWAVRAIVVLTLAGWPLTLSADSNWPQFRGAGASGTSEQSAPTAWDPDTGKNILWKTEIPGLGHASPIIWSNHLFIATAVKPGGKSELKIGLYGAGESYHEKEPHQWRLLCLDRRNGQILWDKLAFESVPRVERHTKATHCNSTPATDGQRIVAIFGSEGLFCFSMQGELLWRKDLGKMDAGPFDAPKLQWGFASSPVLHDNKVVVQCDVTSDRFLAVFDATDGKELWRTPRHEAGGTWCSPAIAESAGSTQIIANGWKHIGGFDFTTGKEIWRMEGGGDIPVPTPLVADGMVVLTSAHGKYRPIRAVRLEARGDVTPPEMGETNAAVVWCHPRLGSYMQTPILVGDLLLSCDVQGVLSCFDFLTGKLHYSERLAGGSQGFSASPVAAAGKVYITGELGDVFVVEAKPEFKRVGMNKLGEECLATPALSGGKIFFRTRGGVMAIGAPR